MPMLAAADWIAFKTTAGIHPREASLYNLEAFRALQSRVWHCSMLQDTGFLCWPAPLEPGNSKSVLFLRP